MSDPRITCPVPSCVTAKNPSHLMCLAHWRMVPVALQQAVLVGARAMARTTRVETLGAARVWRDARDQAVKAVEERLLQRHARREERAGPSLELE